MTVPDIPLSHDDKSCNAVVLHTISDADHYLLNFSVVSVDSLLFTTTASVEYYLRRHGIICPCLSRYVTVGQMQANITMARRAAQQITACLDALYSPMLGDICDTGAIRFFKALYEYRIYIQLVDYLNLQNAATAAVKQHRIVCFRIYNARKDQFFDSNMDMATFFRSIGITETLVVNSSDGALCKATSGNRANQWIPISLALGNRQRLWAKLGRESRNLYHALLDLRPAPSAIFFDSHDNLIRHVLASQSARNRLLSSTFAEMFAQKYRGNKNPLQLAISTANCEVQLPRQILSCVLRDIEDDFCRKQDEYVSYMKGVKQIVQEYHVRMSIWHFPPVFGKSGLFHEYLMAQGRPVVGFQHGGLFANQFYHEVEISDFSHCTHYVSYGFEYDDVVNIHGPLEACPVVTPFCKTGLPDQGCSKQPVDILFPITNTISMLEFGMCRQRPDILAERQMAILTFLDSRKDLLTFIKPLPNVSSETLAVWDELLMMKHLKLVHNVMLPDLLMKIAPKAIIIEHPSTPLYECLPLDAELFMLNDMVRPIEGSALELLRKRVHYFENVGELVQHLEMFFEGKLPSRRNTEFYDRYVMRGNKAGLVRLFNQLLVTKS